MSLDSDQQHEKNAEFLSGFVLALFSVFLGWLAFYISHHVDIGWMP